jgi:hypothetical protein
VPVLILAGVFGYQYSTVLSLHEDNAQMRNRSLNCILIAVLAVGGVVASSAQELTQAEKEHALQYLESTKKDVVDATKGLSKAQWNFKSAPGRWSVAQVMEHIAAAEDFIGIDFVQKKVMILPAGEASRDVNKIDAAVEATIPDRSHKAQAPEPLVPNNRFGSPDGSLKHFLESRENTEQFLRATPGLSSVPLLHRDR